MIYYNLSSIIHRYRDITLGRRKPLHPSLIPRSKDAVEFRR